MKPITGHIGRVVLAQWQMLTACLCLMFFCIPLAAADNLVIPSADVPENAPSFSQVILVRHAEKQAEGKDPLLTEQGEKRAIALAGALKHTRIRQIITSPLQRTRLTAAPTARAFSISPLEIGFADGLPAHIDAVSRAVHSVKQGAVLVVGHSNTVPAIIAALGGPSLGDLCESEYSDLFVVTLAGDTVHLVHGSYGVPSPASDECAVQH